MTGSSPFFLVDVFATRPLEGNPLAVVPDADEIDAVTMARIARELNQSETTFILRPSRDGADWRLRSFTAAGIEVLGAGHNALGAWWWLAESGRLSLGRQGGEFTQEIGPRLLPVEVECQDWKLTSVSLTQSPPVFGKTCDDLGALASSLGLETADFDAARLPAQVVSTGAAHLMTPLLDRTAMAKARPDLPRLAAVLRPIGAYGCYLFVPPRAAGDSVQTRFFNPVEGIPEDPATGSAAGPLACHLIQRGSLPDGSSLVVEQGQEMSRPGRIEVHVSGDKVRVSGACVTVAEGILRW